MNRTEEIELLENFTEEIFKKALNEKNIMKILKPHFEKAIKIGVEIGIKKGRKDREDEIIKFIDNRLVTTGVDVYLAYQLVIVPDKLDYGILCGLSVRGYFQVDRLLPGTSKIKGYPLNHIVDLVGFPDYLDSINLDDCI